uniref:Uncharacterized protein n=1 Tax=Anguilla anguilla TaxID=7936 RepID=A0A0E9RB04_ANGAN
MSAGFLGVIGTSGSLSY